MVKDESDDCGSYVPKLAETLSESDRYRDKIEIKNRCVTVKYDEASKLEVDLVPCIERGGKFYVCPRDGADFEETDGTGYREWFIDKNSVTKRSSLRLVVRLLKHARDHLDSFECPSIALTTLAAETIESGDSGSECVSTQADALATILSRMSEKLDNTSYPPTIKNPALSSETFDPKWSKRGYNRFRSTIRRMAKDAADALQETDKEKSIAKWRKVCGENFTAADGNGGGSHGGSGAPSPSSHSGSDIRLAPSAGAGASPSIVAMPARPRREATPRPPYAGEQGGQCLAPTIVKPSPQDVSAARGFYPDLAYCESDHSLRGRIYEEVAYNAELNAVATPPWRSDRERSMALLVDAEIKVCLRYASSLLFPWPPVYEMSGIAERVAARENVPLADLHVFPNGAMCLSLELRPVGQFRLLEFLQELVVPALYRMAYAEKYGLRAAQSQLWPELPHDLGEAIDAQARLLDSAQRGSACV